MERITLNAEKDIAFDSPDHLIPWGTKRDNSRNHRFNEKLYALYPPPKRTRVLDLGCSGGGFVRDCLEDGMFAVGLEGSDFSRKFKRAEWRTIPEYLFTCDVTAPFELLLEENGEPSALKFDVITSWELLEHIPEKGLPGLVSNVLVHLSTGGLWIVSVSTNDQIVDGVNLHQTVRPRDWWITEFARLGVVNVPEYVRYFNTQFVRGPKYDAGGSFNLVLARPGEEHAPIPHERLLVRMYDKWLNCRLQRFMRLVLVGK